MLQSMGSQRIGRGGQLNNNRILGDFMTRDKEHSEVK